MLNKNNKIINRIKLMILSIIITFTFGNTVVHATENIELESGIYSIENDVYHEQEIGMTMSRSYLDSNMTVEVRKKSIVYTLGFITSEYMENYRMKLNDKEVTVEILEDSNNTENLKLKLEVDKINADMEALIYVGPMERDVEFGVIPKMETLKLIETIDESQTNKTILILALLIGIAGLAGVVVLKRKNRKNNQ